MTKEQQFWQKLKFGHALLMGLNTKLDSLTD
jgi:hypothetical protein